MVNKYLKYSLILSVIIVWGIIVYKLIHGFNGSTLPVLTNQSKLKKNYNILKDTFTLFVDYPDPFIPETDSTIADSASKKSVATSSNHSINILDTLSIKYEGIIVNPKRKMKAAIINIRGRDLMVVEKEKIAGITIKRIEKNTLVIIYGGKYLSIKKNN